MLSLSIEQGNFWEGRGKKPAPTTKVQFSSKEDLRLVKELQQNGLKASLTQARDSGHLESLQG